MTRRVAVVTTSYPAHAGDAAGHFVAAEVRALAADGAEVTVVAPGDVRRPREEPVARPSTGQGSVRVVSVGGGDLFGWPGVMTRIGEDPSRLQRLPPWLYRARRAVVESGADELVAHWVVPSLWPVALGLDLARENVEVVSHGSDVRLLGKLPTVLRQRLVRTVVQRVDRWRFVSPALYEELARTLDSATEREVARVAVVRPPLLELPDVDRVARELRASVAEKALYVVAARLVPAKRVDACLVWAAAAASTAAPSTRLLVLGDGPERRALADQARALVSPRLRIDLLGTLPRTTTLAWIAAADALLHASREEGLSTVVREAAHYRTEVVPVP